MLVNPLPPLLRELQPGHIGFGMPGVIGSHDRLSYSVQLIYLIPVPVIPIAATATARQLIVC